MSLFKGWFKEEPINESIDSTEPDAQAKPVASIDSFPGANLGQQNTFATSTLGPDQNYLNAIEQRIEESDQPGVDYFEFAKAMRSFMAQGNSAQNAITNAMTALSVAAPDLTVQVLMQTSNHYINVVNEMREQFIAESNDNVRKETEKFNSFEKDFDELLDTLEDEGATEEILGAVKPLFEKFTSKESQKELERQQKMNVAADLVIENITADQENIQKFLNP